MEKLTIDEALQKGIEAHKAGQLRDAEQLYSTILQAQPRHPDANHNMGVLAIGVGRIQEALPFFETALEAVPAKTQFWLSYIEALIELNKLSDAKAVLNNAKSRGIKVADVYELEQRLKCLVGDIAGNVSKVQEPPEDQVQSLISLYSRGKLQQTLKQATKLLQQFPRSSVLYNICGAAHRGLAQLDDSIRAYKRAVEIKPDYAEAYTNMGVIFQEQGDLEEAIEAYNKALAIKPDYFEAHNNIGIALQDQRKLEKAIEAYNRAIKIKPDYADAYYNMGNAFKEQNGREEAVEAYKKAVEIKPDYADAYYNMGNVFKEQNKQKEAIEAYYKAIAIVPNYADAYINMGNVLKEQLKLQEAIEAYHKALAIKPDNAEAYNNVGVTLKERGKLEEAIEAYNKALAIKPDYAEAYTNMGVTLKEQGKLEEAIEAYTKALAINPDYVDAYSNMGITLKEQGKLEEAIEAYNKALAIKPDYADAYSNMGITLKEQGKLEEAIEAYNKALNINPDYAEAYNNLAITLQEQGKLKEAIEAYNKSLAIMPDYAKALENSQSLAVQLLPIIADYGYDFDTSTALANSETVLRPKYRIQNVIKAYLEADFSKADLHNKNFKACDQKLLASLELKDKIFCNAYSNFIGNLLDSTWDEMPNTNNKVYHLGESHCLSYAHRNVILGGSNFTITPRITFGAKAFHFSRTQNDSFTAITRAHFASLPKRSKVFLSYGEIDCRPNEGFITAARKLSKPLEELINQTTECYVQWFLDQNQVKRHHLYFINVPAPVYDKKLTVDLNSEVLRTVKLFNTALTKYSLQRGFNTVDVFKFTVGKEGFSNGLFHIDNRHLGAKALLEIKQQLS